MRLDGWILYEPRHEKSCFLAHLSRRLIGELIVYPWSGPASSIVHNAQTSSQKPLGRSKPNFMWSPWVGGTKFCSRHLGHMTKMAAMPIYGKKFLPFKNLLLQNQRADFHETSYIASRTPAHHSLFCWSDLDLFYGKVKFGNLGFSIGKSENSGFFRNYCSQ